MTSTEKKYRAPLEAWAPNTMVDDWSMLVVGSRRAGKSVLIRSLLLSRDSDWLKQFDFIVVMAGNQHCANEYLQAGVPQKYIHVGLQEQVIKDYWEWVDSQLSADKPIPKPLFIFDDVLCMTSSKKWGKTRTSDCYWLGRLFNEGRHIHASVVLVVQQIGIGLRFLRNADVACFFGSAINCGQDLKSIRQHYLPCDSKTADWILQSCYQHDVIVCEYFRQQSQDWRTKIKLYRVKKQIVNFDARRYESAAAVPEAEPEPTEPGRTRENAPWRCAKKSPEGRPDSKHVQAAVRHADPLLRKRVPEDEG
jgi:hypothetical protein